MSQYVLIASFWVLAVGRGSGLVGVSPGDNTTTTLQPHSPGPPTPPTPLSTMTATVQPSTTADHLSNTSLTFYPILVNRSMASRSLQDLHSTTFTSSIPVITPTYSSSSSSLPNVPKPIVGTQTATPSEEKHNSNTTPTIKHPLSTKIPLSVELTQEVSQNMGQRLFVRRKHLGPIRDHAERVRKLSAVLRMTDSPEPANHSDIQTKHSSNISTTVEVALTNNTNKEIKYNVKHKLLKPTARPAINGVVPKKNASLKLAKDHRIRTKPIMMGIPASSTVLQVQRATSTVAPTPTIFSPSDSEEYYSSYAEYPDVPIFGYNRSGYSEAAVLPDPDIVPKPDSLEVDADVDAEVVLPDDSLADTDLHDHDLIDSVMYIYFGSSERDERGAGRQVLIVGAVISLVAQSLTLISVLRRLRTRPDEHASLILLNAELALTAGNLVFMLGVQATGSQRRCELVAYALHYLHLAACSWFLLNSIYSYVTLQSHGLRHLRPWWLAAWSWPALIVLLCVLFNRRGYETRSFCWVSVARGMLYSFMAPVAVLILLNTCFAVLGLRLLTVTSKTEDSDRKSMRISAILLPVYAVVWFLGVVALENSASLVFPLLFVASSGFLNWFILACWLPADLSLWRESDDDFDDDDDDLYEEVLKTQMDSHPLLEESHIYVCGRRDTCDLQMDPICTISS